MLQAPYMIQLCRQIFNSQITRDRDESILMEICSNWFNDAFEHCSKILTIKPGCTKLWTRIVNLKKFIFQENETALLSDKNPMPVHPHLLTISNCQELSEKVMRDYIHQIPQYLSVTKENETLWQILWVAFKLCILVAFAFAAIKGIGVIRRSKTCRRFYYQITPLTTLLLKNAIRKNMKRIMYETQHLSIVPVVDPKLLKIGCPVFGLRLNRSHLVTVERIFIGTAMKFYDNPADADLVLSNGARQLQRFISESGKCLFVVSIDFDELEDEYVESRCTTRYSLIPIHRIERKVGIRRRI